MPNFKLKDRIDSYQNQTDYRLLNKLPIIIILNGKNFAKATSFLDKPYCSKLEDCFISTTLKLCSEIEGAIFGYHYNDEIILVIRNDQSLETSPWLDNKIQKICSLASSIATLHFNSCVDDSELNILGELYFTSKIFTVPNIPEAINTIIFKQQQNFYTSIQFACFYELLKKYDKNSIKDMILGLSFEEKVDLLQQECQINFDEYPVSFRKGVACYKIPKVIGDTMKNKWSFNMETPTFTKDPSFLNNIFKNGTDIFRQESF